MTPDSDPWHLRQPRSSHRAACLVGGAAAVLLCLLFPVLQLVSKSYSYRWPRPAVGAEVVAIRQPSGRGEPAQLLLVKRKYNPFKGDWCFPGGYVEQREDLLKAAARELREETGLSLGDALAVTQAWASDRSGPEFGWLVAITFVALFPPMVEATAQDDAEEVQWWDFESIPPNLVGPTPDALGGALRRLAEEDTLHRMPAVRAQLIWAAGMLEGA